MTRSTCFREPLLARRVAAHGFALTRGEEPAGLALPRQVHGVAVASAEHCLGGEPPAADAVVSVTRGQGVGVVTADCVPLLLATPDGSGVAAVHAGWRGLAAGVIEAGVVALCDASGAAASELCAGIGPHASGCCYEVDAPVLDALRQRYAPALDAALAPARPGHWMLDLGALARAALRGAGLAEDGIGEAAVACTCCDPRGLASYRRDGSAAGRLVHFVTPARGARTRVEG